MPPCFHPLRAWRTTAGAVILAKEPPDSTRLHLPCGNCLGCRWRAAQAWALRCHLELQQHHSAAFTTLTYDDANKPPTLDKRELQLWLKRLRKHHARSKTARPIRFFACGEYGTATDRPHYHAILYGLSRDHDTLIQDTWDKGITRTYNATPQTIAYTAGYTAKKIGFKEKARPVRLDETGTFFYHWQPPFLQMSRRPGIGAHAKQWPQSWRAYAIHNGTQQPVPRFLHEAWKQQATQEEIEQLIYERSKLTLNRDITELHRLAEEKIMQARQREHSFRRNL